MRHVVADALACLVDATGMADRELAQAGEVRQAIAVRRVEGSAKPGQTG
jgi:hypothetical protein